MSTEANAALQAATRRLDRCYSGSECDWSLFYEPRLEMANFATRYHLVYPALGYFIQLKKQPGLAGAIRPKLDTMYRGLLARRTWSYWHKELSETTWPLQERNLTYAGRLASFIGFLYRRFRRTAGKKHRVGRPHDHIFRLIRESVPANDGVADLRRKLLSPGVDGHVQCPYADQ